MSRARVTMTALLLAAGANVAGAQPAATRVSKDAPAAPGALSDAATRAAVLAAVRGVMEKAIADSAFPGGVAVVGDATGGYVMHGAGRIDWAPDAPAPNAATIWDMASLTKVVATTSAMLQLVAERKVALDAPVQRYLPDWKGPRKETVTVRHLLTHSSGMPSWRPLYKEATNAAEAMALVMQTQLDTLPGARYLYSDLNAILLGEIVRRVSGQPLDQYLAKRVFGPLGMRDTRYLPPKSELARIAPTEFDPWRQRKVHGEVHDENAYMLGGVSGHAGLFSTAADLSRLARAYLNGGTLDGTRVFDAATIAEFTRVQDTTISRRAIGWETPTGGNSAGQYLSRRAFGHTGFTGTSLWIDPARGVYVILLTNRVNPTRQNTRIGGVRTALANAAVRAMGGSPVFGSSTSSAPSPAPATPAAATPRPAALPTPP
ncbi:serine hydrolase domain-containing protein [Roseisolibacter agri]|nr:serine hydrolase domain-containing protein [Roseisolibacter agri]